jgi:hypothetical protein
LLDLCFNIRKTVLLDRDLASRQEVIQEDIVATGVQMLRDLGNRKRIWHRKHNRARWRRLAAAYPCDGLLDQDILSCHGLFRDWDPSFWIETIIGDTRDAAALRAVNTDHCSLKKACHVYGWRDRVDRPINKRGDGLQGHGMIDYFEICLSVQRPCSVWKNRRGDTSSLSKRDLDRTSG